VLREFSPDPSELTQVVPPRSVDLLKYGVATLLERRDYRHGRVTENVLESVRKGWILSDAGNQSAEEIVVLFSETKVFLRLLHGCLQIDAVPSG